MKLIPLPAFQDKYLWVSYDGHRALAVDPGDAQPVPHCVQRDGLQLGAILVKHHRPDHFEGADVRFSGGCTHDHTSGNLNFAQAAEPADPWLIHYSQRCEESRKQEFPTLPSTVDQEKPINPFLRTRLPGVAQAARAYDAAPPRG